jgi:hypothetical protein
VCGWCNYWSTANVTRWQMAVFLATGMVGPSGTVPTTGTVPSVGTYNCSLGGNSLFADVPPTDAGCRFIHYIYANGVTSGCGGGNYCPASNVTRWQMAVFLVTAFKIPLLYWPPAPGGPPFAAGRPVRWFLPGTLHLDTGDAAGATAGSIAE